MSIYSVEHAYTPEELRNLQLVELDILKKFDYICKKHDLTYFGMYGTALGAVRHQGIIPWDDDIDVCMPRADYEKLMEIIDDELAQFEEGYTFISAERSKYYPFMTGRIMRDGTEFRTKSLKNVKCEFGMFLDIFPFDNVPDNEWQRRRQFVSCWIWEKMMILRNLTIPNLHFRDFRRYIIFAICILAQLPLKLFPRKFLFRRAKKAATRYQHVETRRMAYTFGLYISTNMYDKEDFYPLQWVPFEDTRLPIPKETPMMLATIFGDDYMTPLPEGQRSFIVPYSLDFGDVEIPEIDDNVKKE